MPREKKYYNYLGQDGLKHSNFRVNLAKNSILSKGFPIEKSESNFVS